METDFAEIGMSERAVLGVTVVGQDTPISAKSGYSSGIGEIGLLV